MHEDREKRAIDRYATYRDGLSTSLRFNVIAHSLYSVLSSDSYQEEDEYLNLFLHTVYPQHTSTSTALPLTTHTHLCIDRHGRG